VHAAAFDFSVRSPYSSPLYPAQTRWISPVRAFFLRTAKNRRFIAKDTPDISEPRSSHPRSFPVRPSSQHAGEHRSTRNTAPLRLFSPPVCAFRAQQDEVIWQVINRGFCSFKSK
jgi:hypothetical protein